MRIPPVRLVLAAMAATTLTAACVDGVARSVAPAATQLVSGSHAYPRFLQCPHRQPGAVLAAIGPLGGELVLGAHAVRIPAGAVPSLTTFALTIPDSKIAEVQVTAVGVEHYVFGSPVSVTISYQGCLEPVEPLPLTVWYVAPVTRTPLENMGGVVNREAKTVTFSTSHFSGYAIAN